MLYKEIKDNRIVWLRAIRMLEREECLVPFTYLTDAADTHSLRDSACLPYRLASVILGIGTITPVIKSFHLDTAGQGPPPQYAMHLVPGGRWIFHTDRGMQVNSGEPSRISCSDLSRLGGTQPICSLPLRFPVDTWPTIYGIQSDSENSRVTIVVSYQRVFPTWVWTFHLSSISSLQLNGLIFRRCLEVLHATWPPGGVPNHMPTWSRAAYLNVDTREAIRSIVLEGQYIAVPLSDSLIIWHWHTGEWVTLRSASEKVSRHSVDIAISNAVA
jgi:hypothetical protein